ncbi:MAG: hypothetical protein FK734_08690, partial [Asgard group archaeon]|nr:hypothetical protein [Asgard group archaeon]
MTLHLAFILHIYQPPTQQPSILKQIIKESYKPLFNLLLEKNNIQITFNINGSLFELLDFYEEEEIIDSIRTLIERKQIDLVGSSCYHAILPLIPKEEILRQIQLNEELHHKVLGKYLFKPKGFWLPEMAYEYRVIEPLIESNYEWTVLSSIAYPDTNLPDDIIPLVEPNFITYFRNDLLSNLISFNHPSVEEFYEQMKGEKDPESDNYYLILA